MVPASPLTRSPPPQFYCLDDDKVRRAPLAEVLGSKAYLLTYVKKTLPFAEKR